MLCGNVEKTLLKSEMISVSPVIKCYKSQFSGTYSAKSMCAIPQTWKTCL